jgi:diguanylate cyclase (GGDEF)-like protein
MDQEDFVREIRNAGVNRDSKEDFRFRVDLCAPMLGKSRSVTGAISVGGITRHMRFEKRLLSMIADMGAVALANRDLMDESVEKANSDGLTGLFNKRYLQSRLGEEIHKAETARRPLSLFIFDLDHFKKLNDTHGHLTGDKVLKETAQILKTECMRRGEDVAARWGGEEFLVILPGTPKDGAAKFAEKVRQALEKHSFTNDDGAPIGAVTLSGGVASFPEDGRQQSELVGMADEALYLSKKSGRNRITKAQPKLMSDVDDEPVPGGMGRAASGM